MAPKAIKQEKKEKDDKKEPRKAMNAMSEKKSTFEIGDRVQVSGIPGVGGVLRDIIGYVTQVDCIGVRVREPRRMSLEETISHFWYPFHIVSKAPLVLRARAAPLDIIE
jgi:hypothetical protein